MQILKESWRRHRRYIMVLVILFLAATILLVVLAGDSQDSPFIYIVH